MHLLTPAHIERLNANYRVTQASQEIGRDPDHQPVVKLFTPWAGATWLLTELSPADDDYAFGLCDLGVGSPELGYVLLSEIASLRGPGGLTVERDLRFTAKAPISAYAKASRAQGRIVEDF